MLLLGHYARFLLHDRPSRKPRRDDTSLRGISSESTLPGTAHSGVMLSDLLPQAITPFLDSIIGDAGAQ
jgi:hypothetical protein